jgi:glucosamine-6-phosphate deaminase
VLVEKLRVELLDIEIYETRGDLGVAAGRAVAARIRTLQAANREVRIIFASAPSQNEFLSELGALPDIDWQRVTAFHMDEYVGLSAAAPRSFASFLKDRLFDRVRPGAVHYLDGLATDLEGECRRYADLLHRAPIDIVCAGIGENGHLAFNDPPEASFDDPCTVKVVQLALRSREQQVNDGCFPKLSAVPRQALTLTIPALMAARHSYCMVPDPTKAEAVRDTLLGPIAEHCPATVMRRHESAVLYLDRDAAALFEANRSGRG